jgi:hypothetical protein
MRELPELSMNQKIVPGRAVGRHALAALIAALALALAGCGGGGGGTAANSSSSGASSSASSSGSTSGSGSGSSSTSGGMGGTAAIAISPARAALTTSQVTTFTATVTGTVTNLAVTWNVDGTVGGSATLGTISAVGVYSPPPTGGTHVITATSQGDPSAKASVNVAVTDLAGVFTYHNDVARTGQNLQEYALTAAIVSNPATFGKLFSCTVDDAVYAQPLFVANQTVPLPNGGTGVRNVVYVATMNDSVYAFDADGATDPGTGGCLAYWYRSFIAPPTVTAVPYQDTGDGDDDVPGNYGISGTPVIGNGSLYVVARIKNTSSTTYQHQLHALSLQTGLDQTNSPVTVVASNFVALAQAQRPALLLSQGNVYVAFGSNGDAGNYHGYLLGYNATTLAATGAFVTAPNGVQGAIWMSGDGPAADAAGSIYFSTANGDYDGSADFSDSFLRVIQSSPTTLSRADSFTPHDQSQMQTGDLDFGAGGVMLLPATAGSTAHQNLGVALSKGGGMYLFDLAGLGGYNTNTNGNLQTISAATSEFFSTPAVWSRTVAGTASNTLYLGGTDYQSGDHLKAYTVSGASVSTSALAQSSEIYMFPGTTPVVSSAPGSSSALVWTVDTGANGTGGLSSPSQYKPGPAILRAYDATTLGTALYASSTTAADTCGNAIKFVVPTVANGKVYVGGYKSVTIYGLKSS